MKPLLRRYIELIRECLEISKNAANAFEILKHVISTLLPSKSSAFPELIEIPEEISDFKFELENIKDKLILEVDIESQFIDSYYDTNSLFIETLFIEVAYCFLDTFTASQRAECFDPFFYNVPISASIVSILNYISKSLPISSLNISNSNSNECLLLPSCDVATKILKSILEDIERFKDISSHLENSDYKKDICISLLCTIPDRFPTSNLISVDFFSKQNFIPFIVKSVLTTFLCYKNENTSLASTENTRCGVSEERILFWGRLMSKLVVRGHVILIAITIYNEFEGISLRNSEDCVRILYNSIEDCFVKQKILYGLLHLFEELKLSIKIETIHKILEVMILDKDGIVNTMDSNILQDILIKRPLHIASVDWILDKIFKTKSGLIDFGVKSTRLWCNENLLHFTSIKKQAYMNHIIERLVHFIGSKDEGCTIGNKEITCNISKGICLRLDCGIEALRFQGMRVANEIGKLNINSDPIFKDIDLDFETLSKEEIWIGYNLNISSEKSVQKSVQIEVPSVDKKEEIEIDSDDESFFSSENESEKLTPLNLDENDKILTTQDSRPMTLRDVMTMLKKSGTDPQETVKALKYLPSLLDHNPDELNSISLEMSKLLISIYIPKWAIKDIPKIGPQKIKNSDELRVVSLTKILVVDKNIGSSLGLMIGLERLSDYQRLAILDSLCDASQHLSTKRCSLQLQDQESSNLKPKQGMISGRGAGDRCIIFAPKSLEKIKMAELRDSYKNEFLDVALEWTHALIECCSIKNGTFDPFSHSHFILARILSVVGKFAESCSQSHISINITKSILDFVTHPKILNHLQASVRRSAIGAIHNTLNGLSRVQLKNISDNSPNGVKMAIGHLSKSAGGGDRDEGCQMLATMALVNFTKRIEMFDKNILFGEFHFQRNIQPKIFKYKTPENIFK